MCAPALRSLLAVSTALLLALPARAIIDQDGDGWSDLWQMAYGTGFLPDADDDGDGRTNRQEHDEGDRRNPQHVAVLLHRLDVLEELHGKLQT